MSKERVFAYTQSKTIKAEELQNISGGQANGSYWTNKVCGHVTGSTGAWDTMIDVVLDW